MLAKGMGIWEGSRRIMIKVSRTLYGLCPGDLPLILVASGYTRVLQEGNEYGTHSPKEGLKDWADLL